MRRLVLKLIALAAPVSLLVAAVVSAHAIGGVRFIAADRYQAYRALELGASLHAVAVGDSHAALGFRSEHAAVYSLAFPAELLSETALKAGFAQASLPRLRVVFLQAQPHTLSRRRAGEPRETYRELFATVPGRLPRWWELAADPCCRSELVVAAFRDALDAPFGRLVPDIDPAGFAKYPETLRLRGDRAAAARAELGDGLTLDGPMQQTYRELVLRLRADGLDVVLTRYPLTPEYLAVAGTHVLEQTRQFLDALERASGARRCGAWDAIRDPALFLNADHLTPEGAQTYWRQTLVHCVDTRNAAR